MNKLIVIVGSMFSGKSTELQRQGRRHELAKRFVAYFKPETDNRYNPEAISTHDGDFVDAFVVESSQRIVKIVDQFEKDFGTVQVICIDEIQFFDEDIVEVIDELLEQGKTVIVAGLDLDRFGEPFGAVPVLMAKAEEVVKVKAVCNVCGNDAWISHSETTIKEQVVVGEKDIYFPLCRKCYYKRSEEE